MNNQNKKENSWVNKLPAIIVVLAVLVFIIIAFSNHNQYRKWKTEQSALSEKISQTNTELELLRDANGALQNITKKLKNLEQQAADTTVALERLYEERKNAESALSELRQELSALNGQVSQSRNAINELTKETESLESTNQQLRNDILNKKSVLDSIAFLQKQKPVLEQNIRELKERNDLTAQAWLELQAKLEALQQKTEEGEGDLLAQTERRTALSNELAELTETIKTLTSQKEKLTMLDDDQKKLEYIEYLQQQKEALEVSIKDLLERGRELEENNLKLQENTPTR